ncbi:unnamed protein product [Polarella glacialis]|uniref:C3H1-type domain-containing protein n=3 Tax=Polarella glacialis TaxID=89957 RepID=A0A813KVC3_POLGL|nr:unnamed protein product [Polarella glacialis]|mmetsp:Transcript_24372/g.39059  ORF Transcript_24372/g.39059 Transcript_24372/m.39059 type:complete len:299 (-) Transcript_24372:322-1218(-)|eukprot:CAMPEP_0115096560 /NCGR_PEP_ID=MMETSP0227-20121206/29806_1 /TAXON_ID=89957 /ORGANISM="Polarella glacialis, Strain CCMP 1383" /LENGTH=298 /DNA_ID=CAMNT_0002490337 /DNA_START=136 /DNA_END=1032 /DNA_ORIENTATION=+
MNKMHQGQNLNLQQIQAHNCLKVDEDLNQLYTAQIPVQVQEAVRHMQATIRQQQREMGQMRLTLENEAVSRAMLVAELETAKQDLAQRNQQVKAMSHLLEQEMGVKLDLVARREESPHSVSMRSSPNSWRGSDAGSTTTTSSTAESAFASVAGSQGYAQGQDATAQVALPQGMPTVGSRLHAQGSCKPCFYVFSKAGCGFGRSCIFCHLDHAKRKKERPPKIVREECKNIAREVFQAKAAGVVVGTDPEDLIRQRQEIANAGNVTTQYALSVVRALQRQAETLDSQSQESFDSGGWSL